MNNLDIIFLVIIGGSMVLAAFKGFIKELVSLVAFVAGLILAGQFHGPVARFLSRWVDSPVLAQVLGFLAVFFGVLLVAGIAVFIADRILKFTHLKWIDRVLGAMFGVVRGWLISTVLVLAMTSFAWQVPWLEQSALAPYLLMSARLAAHAVPGDMHREFDAQYRQIYQKWLEMMDTYRPDLPDGSSPRPEKEKG